MVVVHTSERDPRAAGLHIPQTSVGRHALADIQLVRRSSSEVLPKCWAGARGSPSVVRPERVAEAGTGDVFQGTGQEAVDNTEVPEQVAGVS